jgi:3'(2'), 5'-bisphosphate nucleotidase
MIGKAIDAVIKASDILKDHWNVQLKIETKMDGSLVTDVDLKVNEYLTKALSYAYSVPVVSEEAIPDWEQRKIYRDYWLIDPLDGTKEYVNRYGDFCICVAYMRNQRPLCGIIFAPALDELYFAVQGGGAYLYQSRKKHKLKFPITNSLVLAQGRFDREPVEFCQRNSIARIATFGAGLKFGKLATGAATVCAEYVSPSEWDVAAGDIIVWESGGRMVGMQSKAALVYNNENLKTDPYFALGHGVLLTELRV